MRRRHKSLDAAGSLHFLTTVTRIRGRWFVEDPICEYLLRRFEFFRLRHKIQCFGYVLMPDHLHSLVMQDDAEYNVQRFMADFKRETAKHLVLPNFPRGTLWAEGYDDVPVPGTDAAMTKLQYMMNNPVRRNLVRSPSDYRWSSFYSEKATEPLVTVAAI